jgi:hypothetical protein
MTRIGCALGPPSSQLPALHCFSAPRCCPGQRVRRWPSGVRSRAPRCSAAGERGARVSSQFATGRSFDGSGKVQGCTPAAGRSGVPAAVAAAGPRPSETKLGAQPCGRRQERVTPFLRGQDSGGSPSGPSGGLEEHRKGRDDSGTRRCVDERRQWLTWGDVAVRSRGCSPMVPQFDAVIRSARGTATGRRGADGNANTGTFSPGDLEGGLPVFKPDAAPWSGADRVHRTSTQYHVGPWVDTYVAVTGSRQRRTRLRDLGPRSRLVARADSQAAGDVPTCLSAHLSTVPGLYRGACGREDDVITLGRHHTGTGKVPARSSTTDGRA